MTFCVLMFFMDSDMMIFPRGMRFSGRSGGKADARPSAVVHNKHHIHERYALY